MYEERPIFEVIAEQKSSDWEICYSENREVVLYFVHIILRNGMQHSMALFSGMK